MTSRGLGKGIGVPNRIGARGGPPPANDNLTDNATPTANNLVDNAANNLTDNSPG